MKIDYQKLTIGDRLIRTKGGLFSRHHAIYVGFWEDQHVVAENQINIGVRYLLLDDFLNEGKLKKIHYHNYDVNTQEEIIDRVKNKKGTKYSLINYNCEHFVNEILTGNKKK